MIPSLRYFENVMQTTAIGLLLLAGPVSVAWAEPPSTTPEAPKLQPLDEATKLNQQALKLHYAGKSKEAIALANQALAIQKKAVGEEHLELIKSLNNLALFYFSQGDYAGSRPYYEQALHLRKKLLGEENADTAQAEFSLADAFYYQKDYASARPHFEQALKIRKKILGDEHIDTGHALNFLADTIYELGDSVGARPYYEQALKVYKKQLGVNHASTARLIHRLGVVLYTQKEYAAARTYYEQAVKIRKKILGEENLETALSLNNLGDVCNALADYPRARSSYEQSLAIRKKVRGEEHLDVADSYFNIAETFYSQANYAAARANYEQALKIDKKVLGEEHATTALLLAYVADTFYYQANYAAARPYYEEALKIRLKVLGEEHVATANIQYQLGAIHQSLGNYAAARPYYEQAVKVRKKLLGDEHLDTALWLNSLGFVSHFLGDYERARPDYEQVLKIREKMLGDEHPDMHVSLNNLMCLEAAMGHWDAAAKLAERNRRGARQYIARVVPSLSEPNQLWFLRKNDARAFHNALSLGLAQRQDPTLATLSAGWWLNEKGIGPTALAEQTLLNRDLAKSQLKAVAGQITNRWVELPRVRQSLPAETVLIDIARFGPRNFQAKGIERKFEPARYVAWIIPAADKGDVQIVDLGPADEIETAVEAARTAIQAAAKEIPQKEVVEATAEKQANESLQKVAELVWKPLADKLGGAKQLILSPDGLLWLVPWCALPMAEDKVLLEAYSLRFAISGRDVIPSAATKLSPADPAFFVDPNYDLSPDEMRQMIQTKFPDRKLAEEAPTPSVAGKYALPRVARLTNSAGEAHAIGANIARLAKGQPEIYAGQDALESVFKKLQRPSQLLLSTHAFFLPDQEISHDEIRPASTEAKAEPIENPLLRCGLLLAGCNSHQSTAGDDGILTGMEIVGVDLRGTDLVVLNACETGVGKIRNGEGVASLRQAFQLAGAKGVVATLWQVPGPDSTQIMNDFFQNLADGQTKTDALRNAQLKRIQSRRDKHGAAHPFFWAAWTLTGE